MAVKFANNVSTSLSAAINATQTTISVADASGLPTLSSGDYVYLTIDTDTSSPTIEVVKVTAISSNSLTVVRGQDGTTASSFSSGTKVELRVTAAALDDISSAADTESVSISGDTMTGDLTVPSITVGDGHTIGDDADDNLEITGSAGENVIIKSGVSTYLRTNGNSNALVIGSSLTSYFYGHVVPNTGGSRDLGTSGTRWRDIYTGTLNASGTISSGGITATGSANDQLHLKGTNTTPTALIFDYNGTGATDRTRIYNNAGNIEFKTNNGDTRVTISKTGDTTFASYITVGPTSGGTGSLIRAAGAFSGDALGSPSGVPLVLQATGSDTTFFGALNQYGRQVLAVNISGSANTGTQRGVIDFYTKTSGSFQKALTLSNDDVIARGDLTVDAKITVSGAGSSLAGPVYIAQQNTTGEGGEITLNGSNGNTSHTLDTVNGTFRIFESNGTFINGNYNYGLNTTQYRVGSTVVIDSSRRFGANVAPNASYAINALQNGSLTRAAYLQANGGSGTGLEINATASTYSGDALYVRQSTVSTGGNLARFANSSGDQFTLTTAGAASFGSTVTGHSFIADVGTDGAVGVRIQRYSSSGRAQMTYEDQSGNQIWRIGMTGPASENFAFFDGSQNVLELDRATNNASFYGDVTIGGNLILTGDINQYNVTDLDVADKTITVNAGGSQTLSDGAGLIIDRGTATDASILWDETNDHLVFNTYVRSGDTVEGGGADKQLLAKGTEADIWLTSTGGGSGTWRVMGSTGNNTKLFRIYDHDAGVNRLTVDTSSNVTIGGNITSGAILSNSHNVGIKFGTTHVKPSNNSGGDADNHADLGTSSTRWKNLYLSGTISSGAITSSGNITSGNDVYVPNGRFFRFTAASSNSSGGFLFGNSSGTGGSITFKRNSDSAAVLTLNADKSTTFAGTISSGAITSSGNIATTGGNFVIGSASVITSNRDFYARRLFFSDYADFDGIVNFRSNLTVLNSAGTGWHTWATRSGGNYNLSVGTITSGAITSLSTVSARADYDISTQGGAQLVLYDNTTSTLNMRFGVDTAIGANGGGSIQVTQSGVSNDRDLKLNPYGGKVGVNVSSGTSLSYNLEVGGTLYASNKATFDDAVVSDSLHIRGDINSGYAGGSMVGGISLWGSSGATTSQIMFKPTNAGSPALGNHGFCTDYYNTYFVMDTTNRGWVFRNATTNTNVASISNTGGAAFVKGYVTEKFAVKNAGVHSSYDFYNNGTSYFNGAVTVDDTLYISGTNGEIRFGNTQVIDPNRVLKGITRADFANFTVTGTSTVDPSVLRYANIGANPEGSHLSHPFFFNDLANFEARGGTVTVSGLNGGATLTECFRANGRFASWNNGNYSGSTMTITLTNLPHGLSYGGYIGIAFGNTSWCPSSCKIEVSTNGGSTWTTRLNSASAKEMYFTTGGAGGTAINAIRFTIGQAANTSSIRVTHIWAYNYNSNGMEDYFVSKGGDTIHKKLTLNSATYADHLELVRGSDTLYLTPSGGQLITNGGLSPDVTNQDDLGRTDKYWANLWLANSLKMAGYTIIDSSRNISNVGSVTSSGAITGSEGIFGSTSGSNQGIQIKSGTGTGDYGRIRYYENSLQRNTIHFFGRSWQNGSLANHSTGAINLDGDYGVSFGAWNNLDGYINTTGLFLKSGRSMFAPKGYFGTESNAVPATVYVKSDGTNNLQRWGSGDVNNANSYRFRIDQNFNFIGNNGSGSDKVTIKSSSGDIFTAGNVTVGDTTYNDGNLHVYSEGTNTDLVIDNRKTYGSGQGTADRARLIFSLSENDTSVSAQDRHFFRIEAGTLAETSSAEGFAKFFVRQNGTPIEVMQFRNTGAVSISGDGSNYISGMQRGALELGSTARSYKYTGGWSGSMQAGILANTSENWEFMVHDAGDALGSIFLYETANNAAGTIRFGRDAGYGRASAEFEGPIAATNGGTGSADSTITLKVGKNAAGYKSMQITDHLGNGDTWFNYTDGSNYITNTGGKNYLRYYNSSSNTYANIATFDNSNVYHYRKTVIAADGTGSTSGAVLNVVGASYNQVNINHQNDTGWGLLIGYGDGSLTNGYHGNDHAAIINVQAAPLHLGVDNDSKMRIRSDGGVEIDNKLYVEGGVNINHGANGFTSITNPNAGNTHFTHRGNRLLTSNGTNWNADGRDPMFAFTESTTSTAIGTGIGITMHNEQNTTNAFSPMIAFSAKSNSNSYNSAYAAILGKKTGTGVDTNWNAGELWFYAMPAANYAQNLPNMRITGDDVEINGSLNSPNDTGLIIRGKTRSNVQYDPVIQLLNEDATPSEGLEIWYDNDVGTSYITNKYSTGSLKFGTATGSAVKSTSNTRFEITGGGSLIFGGADHSPFISETNENTLNAGWNQNVDTADLWINYRGYQDGTTKFRDFRIGDGKNVELVHLDGSARRWDWSNGTEQFNWKIHADSDSASSAWDDLTFQSTTEWGDASSYGVLGGTTGIMLRRPHVVWSSADTSADIRFGRSGGVSSGSWYGVGTLASNEFSIHKDSRSGAILKFDGTNKWHFQSNNIALNAGIRFQDSSSRVIEGNSLSNNYHAVEITGNWDKFQVMGRVLDWSASNLHFGDGYNGVDHSSYYFRIGTVDYMQVGGDFYATGNVIAYYSDARLKKNVETIPNALDIVKGIRGVYFEWNEKSEEVWSRKDGEKDFGLISQEVEAVFPMGVAVQAGADKAKNKGYGDPDSEFYDPLHKGENEEEQYKTVKYDKMVAVALQAIKEQQELIESQQAQIDELKTLVHNLLEK